MITLKNMQDIVLANFNDLRLSGIVMFLDELIVRKDAVGDIPRYRLYKLDGDKKRVYIENWTEFKAAIPTIDMTADFAWNHQTSTGDRTHPFTVTFNDLYVELSRDVVSDSDKFGSKFGLKGNRLQFTLNYLSDADPDLPIKIVNVKIVNR